MAAQRKYTAKGLEKAVNAYWAKVSRTAFVTAEIATGELDQYGHAVMERVRVKNDAGEDMSYTQWVIPPTLGGLCRHLGIHRSTWDRWRDEKQFPEYQEVIAAAEDVLREYLETELLAREGKNTRGVEFALQNNYGAKAKTEIELGEKTRQAVASGGGGLSLAEKMAAISQAGEELRRLVSQEDGQDDGES